MIHSNKATMTLPDEFHFMAVIHEMIKQHYHAKKWYAAEKEKLY